MAMAIHVHIFSRRTHILKVHVCKKQTRAVLFFFASDNSVPAALNLE